MREDIFPSSLKEHPSFGYYLALNRITVGRWMLFEAWWNYEGRWWLVIMFWNTPPDQQPTAGALWCRYTSCTWGKKASIIRYLIYAIKIDTYYTVRIQSGAYSEKEVYENSRIQLVLVLRLIIIVPVCYIRKSMYFGSLKGIFWLLRLDHRRSKLYRMSWTLLGCL